MPSRRTKSPARERRIASPAKSTAKRPKSTPRKAFTKTPDEAPDASPGGTYNWWPIDGLGGVSKKHGLFGAVAGFVDVKLPPGYSSQEHELGWKKTRRQMMTLQFFFMGPNLVWFALACAMHSLAPYDLDAARAGWALDWPIRRLGLNFSVAFCYYGFFHVCLYWANFSKRKYSAGGITHHTRPAPPH